MTRIFLLAVLSILMIDSASLYAADPIASTAPAMPAATPFDQGNAYFSLTFDNVWAAVSHSRADLYGSAIGLHYYVLPNFALIGEIPVTGVAQDGPDTMGAGFTLLARYHFYTSPTLTLFVDGGSGFLLTGNAVPEDGTKFNFVSRVGLGATCRLADQWFLEGGARLAHLSNAGIEGSDRNPAINLAIEGYIGVMYAF